METPFGSNGRSVPTGRLRVDWSHPLARGLILCYVPGVTGGIDLAAQGGAQDLVFSDKVTLDAHADGPSLKSTKTFSGTLWAAHKTSIPSSHPARNWSQCTLFWRGLQNAGETLDANGHSIFGIEVNDSASNPYAAAVLGTVGTNLVAFRSSGSTFNYDSIGAAPSAGTPFSFAATFIPGGNIQGYLNGTALGSPFSFGGAAPTYGATATVDLAGETGYETGPWNSHIACMWDRALSAEEIFLVSVQPYCFLLADDDDAAQYLAAGGDSPAQASAAGEASSSAIGTAIGAGVGAAAGDASASAAGATGGSIASASGVGTAGSVGASVAASAAASSGIGAASGVTSGGERVSIGVGRVEQVMNNHSPITDIDAWPTDLTISSINTGTDVLTSSANHDFHPASEPGPFTLETTGSFPGGLDGTTRYWVIIVSADTFKLATSGQNAAAGTAVNITSSGSGTLTLKRTIETSPGSALIAAVARGRWHLDGSPATDSKGNNYSDLDIKHDYATFSGTSVRTRIDLSPSVGAAHSVIATVPDFGDGTSDEVTAVLVEVLGGSRLVDYSWVERDSAASITSDPVTTDGESLVVIFLWGTNFAQDNHVFTPTDSGWEFHEYASATHRPDNFGYLQLSVFSKWFPTAQINLTAEFSGVSNEGALMGVFAFAPANDAAASSAGQGAASAIGASASAGAASAAGSGASAGVGLSDFRSAAVSNGSAAASGIAASQASAAAVSIGEGAAGSVGASIAECLGSSAGVGEAAGAGSFESSEGSIASAGGVGAATGAGRSDSMSVAGSDGAGTAAGIGAAQSLAEASAAGFSAANGDGAATSSAAGSSAGSAVSTGVGSFDLSDGAAAVASGAGAATGVGSSIAATAGASDGLSLAIAAGAGASGLHGQKIRGRWRDFDKKLRQEQEIAEAASELAEALRETEITADEATQLAEMAGALRVLIKSSEYRQNYILSTAESIIKAARSASAAESDKQRKEHIASASALADRIEEEIRDEEEDILFLLA